MFAAAAALIGAFALAFFPTGTRVSESTASDAAGLAVEMRTVERTTLVETEGLSVLILLAIPVALAGVGAAAVLLGWRRPVAISLAVVLGLFCVVGAMSVGLYFLPAAVALGIAAGRARPPTPARTT